MGRCAKDLTGRGGDCQIREVGVHKAARSDELRGVARQAKDHIVPRRADAATGARVLDNIVLQVKAHDVLEVVSLGRVLEIQGPPVR